MRSKIVLFSYRFILDSGSNRFILNSVFKYLRFHYRFEQKIKLVSSALNYFLNQHLIITKAFRNDTSCSKIGLCKTPEVVDLMSRCKYPWKGNDKAQLSQ